MSNLENYYSVIKEKYPNLKIIKYIDFDTTENCAICDLECLYEIPNQVIYFEDFMSIVRLHNVYFSIKNLNVYKLCILYQGDNIDYQSLPKLVDCNIHRIYISTNCSENVYCYSKFLNLLGCSKVKRIFSIFDLKIDNSNWKNSMLLYGKHFQKYETSYFYNSKLAKLAISKDIIGMLEKEYMGQLSL